MASQDERDHAEEAYNRAFCIPCGESPCRWDGQPDGFHTDGPAPRVAPSARMSLGYIDGPATLRAWFGQPVPAVCAWETTRFMQRILTGRARAHRSIGWACYLETAAIREATRGE